jgi:hypothetical protein
MSESRTSVGADNFPAADWFGRNAERDEDVADGPWTAPEATPPGPRSRSRTGPRARRSTS